MAMSTEELMRRVAELGNEKTTTTTTTSSGSSSGSEVTECSTNCDLFLPNGCSEDEILALCDEYEANIGHMTMYSRNRLKQWCCVLDSYNVSYAINETAEAPRPSWRYCEAILGRLYREGGLGLTIERRTQKCVPRERRF